MSFDAAVSARLRELLSHSESGRRVQGAQLMLAYSPGEVGVVLSGVLALHSVSLRGLQATGWRCVNDSLWEVDLSDSVLLQLEAVALSARRLKLCRATLPGALLSGATLSWCSLSGADLTGAALRKSTLLRCDVSGARLQEADLSGARIDQSTLCCTDLSAANLSEARFSQTDLRGAVFHTANLSGAVLSNSRLGGANLSGACLRAAALNGADLRDADLSGADLSGADLRAADLRGADLTAANLTDVDWRGALRELSTAGPSTSLEYRDLSGWEAIGQDLSGADLRGADLRGAVLSGANLQQVSLWGADLRGADLRGADLRGADLRGASLLEVDLTGTRLEGALISETLVSAQTLQPPVSASQLAPGAVLTLCGFRLDLCGVQLHGACIVGLHLQGVRLREADLSGARLETGRLVGCDLRGADLSRVAVSDQLVLAGVDLRGADLRAMDVSKLLLVGCIADEQTRWPGGEILDGAVCLEAGADLRCAYLANFDLRGADLRGADLSGAWLRDTDLRGAQLEGAQLEGAALAGVQSLSLPRTLSGRAWSHGLWRRRVPLSGRPAWGPLTQSLPVWLGQRTIRPDGRLGWGSGIADLRDAETFARMVASVAHELGGDPEALLGGVFLLRRPHSQKPAVTWQLSYRRSRLSEQCCNLTLPDTCVREAVLERFLSERPPWVLQHRRAPSALVDQGPQAALSRTQQQLKAERRLVQAHIRLRWVLGLSGGC